MKKYSRFVLFVLIASVISLVGCSSSGGGGSSSNDDDITNAEGVIENYYKLTDSITTTKKPSYVNIVFHIEDSIGNYITSLGLDDLEVLENDQPLPLDEAALLLTPNVEIPHKLKTVLMIDNSTSTSGSDLADMKTAAKNIIEDISVGESTTGKQYFKIYSFSDTDHIIPVISFWSKDKKVLTDAIESIGPGNFSTSLYEAVKEGVSNWSDSFGLDLIEEGLLIILTNGIETSDSASKEEALSARGNKKIITIGVGDDIKPDVLAELGNTAFYRISSGDEPSDELEDESEDESEDEEPGIELADIEALRLEVTAKLDEIRQDLVSFSSTFYRLNYLSPKSSETSSTHSLTLTLKVKGNKNTNDDDSSTLDTYYDCSEFFSVREGIHIDDERTIRESYHLNISRNLGGERKIRFNVYLNESMQGMVPKPPVYSIDIHGTSSITVGQDPESEDQVFSDGSGEFMRITPVPGEPGAYTVFAASDGSDPDVDVKYDFDIEVEDSENEFSRIIKVHISDTGISDDGLIAHYKFDGDLKDSSPNNLADATATGVEYTEDRFGNPGYALELTSKIAYIKIPDVKDEEIITVSMWFKFKEPGLNQSTLLSPSENNIDSHLSIRQDPYDIGFYNNNVWHSSFYTLTYVDPYSNPYEYYNRPDSHIGYNPYAPVRNYYHIVLVKENNRSKLYIHYLSQTYSDGANLVQDSYDSFRNDISPLSIIGNSNTYNEGALGIIDGVRIYDYALTEGEIENIAMEIN